MVISYIIHTPMMHDARGIAMRRATAEGWSRASVIAIKKVGLQDYEVTLIVSK